MTSQQNAQQPQIDSKLLPVMREAVATVQMILFKVLRESMQRRYADWPESDCIKLAGAVVNNLFGTQPTDPAVASFGAAHRELVDSELRELAEHCRELIPFLTDTLRMKTICDNQEGIHSIPSLLMAKALGILQEERALPMPSTFMLSVRTLATQHGLVEPMQVAPPPEATQ